MVCDYRPLKKEKYRVRLTVGGDKLDYDFDSTSPAASLVETKLLLNSVISDSARGARFMTIDIKDFFLQTHMKEPEFMKIHSKYFDDSLRKKYNLNNLISTDNYVYCQIDKGMYGLKQAARLAHDDLVLHLAKYGYHPDKICPNIWTHKQRKTTFCLCVDDFGINFFNQEDKMHLINALRDKYEITTDESGEHFCGLSLKWNYTHGHVDISMPGFVEKTLKKLNFIPSKKHQFAPHEWTVPIYGKNRQFAPPDDNSPRLSPKETKQVQSVVGSFLYYGRAIDNTILPALNEISLMQSAPTTKTNKKINMLLNYLNTYKNAVVRFHASDMTLYVDSDAAYLVAPKAKSRIAGFFYCSNNSTTNPPSPPLNGPFHVECKILRHVVTSAAEAETAGLFYNCQTAIHLRHMLAVLGHPQPQTQVKTDNGTASQFVSDTIKNKRSKSWDVRYHWLSERQNKGDFKVYWDAGKNNLADYHTKHHSPTHHKNVRRKYILQNFLMKNVFVGNSVP